MPANQRQ